ncbi:hypothetical protein DEJ50_02980 [Streptomyces venezuelae]|uniref:Uncharacterized protein n=1 Tax=Streptomyces venezuelae TaxID=54571 RepID=A0A5P2D1H7_STRVZ|nr:DUF5995 family protein [Streptomyces venezuelae]QES46969.1 hypothetical protein DEJ50_02980 [Streptomyces venezuelae]
MTQDATGVAAERVQGVVRELTARVMQYDAARDHRAVFAYTYFRLTSDLAASLRGNTPSFRTPEWVADLSVSLAAAYFGAMDAIDGWLGAGPRPGGEIHSADMPEHIPKPWRDVYAASTARHSYVLEEVLFSMMAHMSYDLPLALRALAPAPAAGGDLHRHLADFHRMNDLLASSVDAVQHEIAARYCRRLHSLDRLFTRDDELFTSYGIRVARGLAWFNCDRLLDPAAAVGAQGSISRSTAAFIAEFRSPDDWRRRHAFRVLRALVPSRRQWPAPGTALTP